MHRLDNTDFAPDKRILVTPNQNFRPFEVSGSFRVTADITTTSADPVQDSWAAITIGGNQLVGPVPANGFAVLVRPGGVWQAFDGTTYLGAGSTAGTTNYRACFEVVNNKVKVFINGVPLAGDYEHPIANLGVANYITLSTHAAPDAVPVVSRFDNLVISVLPEPVLPATVILADNYNTADTTDLDANLASRQTGTVAPTGYASAVSGTNVSLAIHNNQVKITNPDDVLSIGIFWPALDFLPCERFSSFRIRFKVSPMSGGPYDSWAAIKFREPTPTVGVAGGIGPGILIRPAGGWQAFIGGTSIGAGAVPTASTYEFDIEVRTNLAKATINGQVIATFSIPASTSPHHVALMSFASTTTGGPVGVSATFDDFEFAALGAPVSIPAPVLFNPARVGTTATFQFNSVNGVVYLAEYKDDLIQPLWSLLGNAFGTGGAVTVTDTNAVSAQRFYRLRVP